MLEHLKKHNLEPVASGHVKATIDPEAEFTKDRSFTGSHISSYALNQQRHLFAQQGADDSLDYILISLPENFEDAEGEIGDNTEQGIWAFYGSNRFSNYAARGKVTNLKWNKDARTIQMNFMFECKLENGVKYAVEEGTLNITYTN